MRKEENEKKEKPLGEKKRDKDRSQKRAEKRRN